MRQGLRFASTTVVSLYIGVQQHWESAGVGEKADVLVQIAAVFEPSCQ